jgi:hypothetical protein
MPSAAANAVECTIPPDEITANTKASFKKVLRKNEFKFQAIDSPKDKTLMMIRKPKPARHYNEFGVS